MYLHSKIFRTAYDSPVLLLEVYISLGLVALCEVYVSFSI